MSDKWIQRGLSTALLAFAYLLDVRHPQMLIALAFAYTYGRFDKGHGY